MRSSASSQSRRGKLKPFFGSTTLPGEATSAARAWSGVRPGRACMRSAIHEATSGAACDVPANVEVFVVLPAEVTSAPGAYSAMREPLLLKHVGRFAEVDGSVQPRTVRGPQSWLQVAPIAITRSRQAGAETLVGEPWFPADAVITVPFACRAEAAWAIAIVNALVASQLVANSAFVPRLMLTTRVSGCWVATQSIAATTSDAQQCIVRIEHAHRDNGRTRCATLRCHDAAACDDAADIRAMPVGIRRAAGAGLGCGSVRATADAGRRARAEALLADDAPGEIRMVEADSRIDHRSLDAGANETAVAYIADACERCGDVHVPAAAAVEIDALHGRVGLEGIECLAVDLQNERGDGLEAPQFGIRAGVQRAEQSIGLACDAFAAFCRRVEIGRVTAKNQHHACATFGRDLRRDVAACFRLRLRLCGTGEQGKHDGTHDHLHQARSIHRGGFRNWGGSLGVSEPRIVRDVDPGRRTPAIGGTRACGLQSSVAVPFDDTASGRHPIRFKVNSAHTRLFDGIGHGRMQSASTNGAPR